MYKKPKKYLPYAYVSCGAGRAAARLLQGENRIRSSTTNQNRWRKQTKHQQSADDFTLSYLRVPVFVWQLGKVSESLEVCIDHHLGRINSVFLIPKIEQTKFIYVTVSVEPTSRQRQKFVSKGHLEYLRDQQHCTELPEHVRSRHSDIGLSKDHRIGWCILQGLRKVIARTISLRWLRIEFGTGWEEVLPGWFRFGD